MLVFINHWHLYAGLFELFVSILDLLIQNARIEGHLDTGIVDIKANTIEMQGTPKVIFLHKLLLNCLINVH